MASRSVKIARSFKTVSTFIYAMAMICACGFAYNNYYLETVTGIVTLIICVTMIIATLEKPRSLADKLSNSRFDFVFTLKGRFLMDLLASLFLFAMGGFGFILGTVMLGVLFGIFICGMQMPDLIPELFQDAGINGEIDDSTSASYSRS